MKKNYILLFFVCFISSLATTWAQTEWTGPKITFTKAGNQDETNPDFQDRITENVIITRGARKGIYNIAQESAFAGGGNPSAPKGASPIDTEWAFGTIAAGVGTLSFGTWSEAMDDNPPGQVNRDMVVHLITDDIYIDIKFTEWGQSTFTYERSTEENTLSTSSFNTTASVSISPNPSSDFIQINNLKATQEYIIYNTFGAQVKTGSVSNLDQIDIQELNTGLYFFKLNDTNAIKFVKK